MPRATSDAPVEGEGLRGPVLEGLPSERESRPPAPEPWILEVRLLGLPAYARPPTYVSVMPTGSQGDREDHEIAVVEDETPGLIVFDVTEAVHAGATQLFVLATPTDAFPQSKRIDLPTGINLRETGGRLTAEITIRSSALLEGRVVDGTGTPVKGAWVGVDRVNPPGGPPGASDADADATRDSNGDLTLRSSGSLTGSDGRFGVLAAGEPQVVLVAGWSEKGAPVVSPPITLRVGTRQDVGDLVLGPTERVEGRVRGPELRVGRSTPVRAVRLGAQREIFEGLVRTASGATQGEQATRVHPEGRFELDALDDAVWRVTAEADDLGATVSAAVARRARTFVRGPGAGISLDVRRTLLRVSVHDAAGPLNGAEILVEGPDALVSETHNGGVAPVLLLPETTYAIVAWRDGYSPERRTWTTGPPGTRGLLDLPLTERQTVRPVELAWYPHRRAQLVVVVHGWDGERLPATLRIRDERGQEVPSTWVESEGIARWRVEDELPALGDALLTSELPPGAYRLEVEAPLHVMQVVPIAIGPNNDWPNRFPVVLAPR